MTEGTTQDRGVIYVAAHRPSCVAEAVASAESLRRIHPNLPVTLFTDLPGDLEVSPGPFTSVVRRRWCEAEHGCRGGRICKLSALADSPYERTVFVDTDTRIRQPIDSLFGLLDEVEIAITEATVSFSRNQWKSRMYNSGVIAFRRTDQVRRMLADWKLTLCYHMELMAAGPSSVPAYFGHIDDIPMRHRLLKFDQIALVQHFSPEYNPYELRVKILDHSWNHRGVWRGQGDPPKIHHSNEYKVEPHVPW
ncbi:MAG TPA: hypothetical protein VGB15_19665 [Longimicrobium sp.]|jgi:hypothetical protein